MKKGNTNQNDNNDDDVTMDTYDNCSYNFLYNIIRYNGNISEKAGEKRK